MRLEEQIMRIVEVYFSEEYPEHPRIVLTDLARKVGLLEDALEEISRMPPFHSPYNTFTEEEVANEPCRIALRVLNNIHK